MEGSLSIRVLSLVATLPNKPDSIVSFPDHLSHGLEMFRSCSNCGRTITHKRVRILSPTSHHQIFNFHILEVLWKEFGQTVLNLLLCHVVVLSGCLSSNKKNKDMLIACPWDHPGFRIRRFFPMSAGKTEMVFISWPEGMLELDIEFFEVAFTNAFDGLQFLSRKFRMKLDMSGF